MILLAILTFIIIAMMDLPGLIKNRYKRDILIYSVFFIMAFISSFLFISGKTMLSPNMWFEHVIGDIFHLNY
jgi:hypothetical protein